MNDNAFPTQDVLCCPEGVGCKDSETVPLESHLWGGADTEVFERDMALQQQYLYFIWMCILMLVICWLNKLDCDCT